VTFLLVVELAYVLTNSRRCFREE